MGLHNKKCDSCNENPDILYPLAIIEETPTGDQMVQRWYCYVCRVEIESEADDNKEEKDSNPLIFREYRCGCKYKLYHSLSEVWKYVSLCIKHKDIGDNKELTYGCGCILRKISYQFYIYLEVCGQHEQKE